MSSVSIDIKPPSDTKRPGVSVKKTTNQKKSELAWDVPEKVQWKDSACEHEVNSEPYDDNSLFSLIMDHLKCWFRFTFENIASKPCGQIVLRTADSGLLVAETVSFWIEDSSSLKRVPWLVMLPFLISARVTNYFLSATERITGLPMPTQTRVINTIRTLRNDILVMRKIGVKKMDVDDQDKKMDSDSTTTEDKKVKVEKNTYSDEEEGACAIVDDAYSQISDQAYEYSSTLEESSDCDSELGHKIESMLSTISTSLDETYTSL